MITSLLSLIGETAWTLRAVAKIAGLALGGLVVLAVASGVLGAVFRFATYGGGHMMGMGGGMPGLVSEIGYDGSYAYDDARYGSMPSMDYGRAALFEEAKVSAQNYIMPTPPMPIVNGSRNAEKYERTGYSAQFETRHLDKTCDAIEELKPLEYVLFDTANRGERSCWYSFRVESDHADEVLATIEELGPTDLSVDVQTVAQSIEDSTDRIAALTRQRTTIEATLVAAERAYDDAIRAVRASEVGGLGTLVSDKLATVERLTNAKLSLDEQIRALEAGKGSVVDETAYAHFGVSVSRIIVVDWRELGASWRHALQNAIYEASSALSSILFAVPVLILKAAWFFVLALAALFGLVLFARIAQMITLRIWHWGRDVR